MNLSLGQVVKSKAGRDKGRDFIVVRIVDEAYVELADGDLRKVEKPKKKKIKHMEPTGIVLEDIGNKLKTGVRVSNSEIRKALSALKENNSES